MNDGLIANFAHACELAAIGAAKVSGQGDKELADSKAVEAMREYINTLPVNARVVIGEGERDEAPMLYIGEELGQRKKGMDRVDIAVDPLENTNATAVGSNNAIAVMAVSEQGGLLHAPDMYMEKLVVSAEAADKVHLDKPVGENLKAVAKALGRKVPDLVVVILDRPRNEQYIADARKAGARVKLIMDGDLLPGVAVPMRGTGVHMQLGIGAAPEGVITAAALRCIKGEIQARFWPKNGEEKARMKKMGVKEGKIYTTAELASGKNIVFAATGVTDGDTLRGVNFFKGGARTHSLVMSNVDNRVQLIDCTHVFDKQKINYHI